MSISSSPRIEVPHTKSLARIINPTFDRICTETEGHFSKAKICMISGLLMAALSLIAATVLAGIYISNPIESLHMHLCHGLCGLSIVMTNIGAYYFIKNLGKINLPKTTIN